MRCVMRWSIVWVVLLMAVSAPWAADLKYLFVPGSTAEYSIAVNAVQVMSREGGDLPQTVSYTQTYGTVNRVISTLGAGKGRVETTFKSLNASYTAGGATTSYDSSSPATPPNPFLTLAALVGQKYTTDLSEKGEVLAVAGLAELQQRLLDADPSLKMKMDYDMTAFLDDVSNTGTVQLPAGSVQPGATWVSTMNVSAPLTGNVIVSVTFTYASDEQVGGLNTAKINFDLAARSVGKAAPSKAVSVGASQVQTVNDLNLSGSGTLNLALAEGIVVKMTWTGRMVTAGTATMLASGDTPTQTQQTTSDVNISQNMTLVGRSS